MKGVQFLVDDKGQKIAAVIDLKTSRRFVGGFF